MQKVTVLNPRIADDTAPAALAPQLKALSGARVAFVDNSKVNADLFLSRLKPLLEEKYGVKPGKTIRKLAPKDELTRADLDELASYDAVVQCFGDCGTSTSMTVADGVNLERLGIPTVTVISTAFARAARAQAAGRGMGDLPVIEVPHPMHTAPAPVVLERADAVLSNLAMALTRREATSVVTPRGVQDPELALDAAPDALQEFFFAQGWTDGLPVVPPTHAAVRAMLAAVKRDHAEEIGPIPPRMRFATIEKLAVNAVMAGCRPDYFPVVLAAVDAMLDPECRLYGIRTATNNGTPLLIVNGPIARELDVNAGGNVFG